MRACSFSIEIIIVVLYCYILEFGSNESLLLLTGGDAERCLKISLSFGHWLPQLMEIE